MLIFFQAVFLVLASILVVTRCAPFPVEKYSSGYYRVLLRRSGEYTLCRGWILNMLGDRLAGFTYMGQAEHVKIRVYQNTKFHSNMN